MKYKVINQERDKTNCGKQNNPENNRQRPENPRPRLWFSDVLYGVVQRESRSDCANRSKKEGGHKSVALRPTCIHAGDSKWKATESTRSKHDEIRNCQA